MSMPLEAHSFIVLNLNMIIIDIPLICVTSHNKEIEKTQIPLQICNWLQRHSCCLYLLSSTMHSVFPTTSVRTSAGLGSFPEGVTHIFIINYSVVFVILPV